MWHSATTTGTEIAIATETADETGMTDIAATTTTGSIATTTEMTGDTWTGIGETMGAMIAVMTATIGAGTGIAGSTGTGMDGVTKN
jgi:hypothetical protein